MMMTKMQTSSSRVEILCCKYMMGGSLRLVHSLRNTHESHQECKCCEYLKDKALHNISPTVNKSH